MSTYDQLCKEAEKLYNDNSSLNTIKKVLAKNTGDNAKYNYESFERQLLILVELKQPEHDSFVKNFESGQSIVNAIIDCLLTLNNLREQTRIDYSLVDKTSVKLISKMYLFEGYISGLKSPKVRKEIPAGSTTVYVKTKDILDYIVLHGDTIEKFIENYKNYYNLIEEYNKDLEEKKQAIDSSFKDADIYYRNSMDKRVSGFNDELRGYIKSINLKIDSELENTKNNFQEDYNSLNENIKRSLEALQDEVAEQRSIINEALHDMENNVFREQLAYYFYSERKKLKGDLDFNIFFYAFVISVITWWSKIPKDYSIEWILPLKILVSYVIILAGVQILYNIMRKFHK